jgi:DNA-directed RNA polymerase III subunit RPC3
MVGGNIPSANALAEMEARAREETKQERDELRSPERVLRKSKNADKGKKKGKGKELVEEFSYSLDPQVHLRINYDKFGVLLRNEVSSLLREKSELIT